MSKLANLSNLLRNTLLFDAATCAAMGVGLSVGAGALAGPLGLSETLLRVAGLVLIPFAGLLLWAARREAPSAPVVNLIVAANIAWAVASIALVLGGFVSPTALGAVFVIGQALAVFAIAELEFVGLRRSRALA